MNGNIQSWDSTKRGKRYMWFDISPTQINHRIYDSSIQTDYLSRFRKLVEKWRAQTIYMSSIDEIVEHPAFQEIVAMGEDIIPEILGEIRYQPDLLFLALQIITGENPMSQTGKGDVLAAVDAWLQWANRNNVVAA